MPPSEACRSEKAPFLRRQVEAKGKDKSRDDRCVQNLSAKPGRKACPSS
jgi:hypothetical protein